ncbi:hypothetical protein [uncultured Prevotella sp.]|uniref:hypothetical protein n=1 Tax=uncultured Prevotella sp. TaxID=159272 RepID=UPI0027E28969|nr:hypothetical protein [uncultured Prevotella sp.]
MRKLLKLFLIMLLTIVWTASRAQEITMDFTDNTNWNLPDSDHHTFTANKYGKDNNEITLSGGYHFSTVGKDKFLLLDSDGTLTFSKFDFDVERIVVIGYDARITQSIYVGENLVSDQVKGGLGPRTFWINEKYQAAGNVYTLKVTGGNANILGLEIYKKGSFAPKGKAVFFVAGTDMQTNSSSSSKTKYIIKDGVTISGTNIILNANRNTIYSYFFNSGSEFSISVKTGTITKIEFSGNASLKNLNCDGYTLMSDFRAEWNGSAKKVSFTSQAMARASSITVYVSLPTISLSESEENKIETKSDISISLNRKLVKGAWNTICLPFDVSAAQAKSAFGADVRIAALNAESKGNTLMFDNKTAEGIKAAVPYLIMPSEVKADNQYEFYNVSIKPENVTPAAAVSTSDGFVFKGIYNKVDITQDINNSKSYAAFLGANNTLFKAKSGSTTQGFRAYFAIPNSTATSALRVVVDGNATSIKNINCGVVESDDAVYNLQGQRVDARSLMPGLYIKAGKKFVVR